MKNLNLPDDEEIGRIYDQGKAPVIALFHQLANVVQKKEKDNNNISESNSQTPSLCTTFKSQSNEILRDIERGANTGLGIQEETITDNILSRIQYDQKDNLFTKKFTRKEEGNHSGADWLWCIGEPGAWITFAIQAKIVNPDSGKVNYLHYRNGDQYNLLIAFCKAFHFIPKYAVYAKVDDEIDFFARHVEELKDISAVEWSFSMISPKYIKSLSTRKERQLSNILQYSIPWTYIFCNNPENPTSIASAIISNLEKIYWIFENEFRQQKHQPLRNSFNQTIWENPQPAQFISKDVPFPVLYLLTQKIPFKASMSRVSILSSQPVQKLLDFELEKVEGQRKWKRFGETFERKLTRIQEHKTLYLLPGG